jgi:hypothetical protein
MSKLKGSIGKMFNDARVTAAGMDPGASSKKYSGVGHRPNPATGDVGPDAPKSPTGLPRQPPRGRQRKLGGDIRTALS